MLAAPPAANDAPADEQDAKLRVERGIEAWRKGDWTEVRDLLEPLVREGDIADEFLRESALRYLTEATLLDEGLGPSERDELARDYITRLLDSSPDWAPPSGLHGRRFYDLVAVVRSERDAQLAEACRGQLLSCEADLTELQVDFRASQGRIAALQEALANEDVYLTEVVKRNRGLAFLPFGVGHFTNGNRALGGTFLALEVATGAAGLGLLIYRATNYGCVRTDGFNRKSLVCTIDAPDSDLPALKDEVEAVRNAEAVMGYVFIGSVVLDIALAQVLFKPIEVVEKGQKTRRELDAELDEAESSPRPRRPRAGPGTKSKPDAKLRVRPHPAFVPAGLGLGVTLQF
ncbi:hypothetical protein ENSA5_34910 [Enhygromyxa salina]|uniref:Uncharacterized protein n=1 Tax=Enhygromyxa salina TaxID=215803 RepID=A0A2S9XW65_9BACT|nr:hypothetical protein [Enhygromyxa salina]PRP97108.1 hypothetical protein ENSA5_34910 [Enhygromyxa salina]